MRKTIICDIDGVLLDINHLIELDHLTNQITNWDWLDNNYDKSTPILDNINMICELQNMFDVIYLTGRKEICRDVTINQLKNHGLKISNDNYFCRRNHDFRSGWQFKEWWYKKKLPYLKLGEVHLAIDDDPDIIKMWQRLGLNTLKIRNDNYKG